MSTTEGATKTLIQSYLFTGLNLLDGIRRYLLSPALYRVTFNHSALSRSLGLDLPFWLALRFKALFLARSILGRNDILVGTAARLCDAMDAHLAAKGMSGSVLPVETVNFAEITPEEFHARYIADPRPVVIKGATLDVVGTWSVDWFLENHGDVPVYFALSQGHVKKPLSFFKDSQDPETYLHNSENILHHDPSLLDGLHIDQFEPHGGMRHISCQLFLGMRAGTGAPFHCAHYPNFFFNIHGRKKWTFLNPVFTYLMYPMPTAYKAFVASSVGLAHRVEPGQFPLYDRAPRLEVELEPGDVLFSPGWWWHSVENLTEQTVAVATRHVGQSTPSLNYLFSASQVLSWRLHEMVRRIVLARLRGGKPMFTQAYAMEDEEVSYFEQATHSEESIPAFLDRPDRVWGKHLDPDGTR